MTHTSLQGRWLRVNRKLCEMTGYSEQELVEGSYQHITPSEDTPADTALMARMRAGEIPSFEMENAISTRVAAPCGWPSRARWCSPKRGWWTT